MKIRYSYKQRCVAECSGVLEVPAEVVAEGDDVVCEYIREHEADAMFADIEVMDFNEEVEGTMEWEES